MGNEVDYTWLALSAGLLFSSLLYVAAWKRANRADRVWERLERVEARYGRERVMRLVKGESRVGAGSKPEVAVLPDVRVRALGRVRMAVTASKARPPQVGGEGPVQAFAATPAPQGADEWRALDRALRVVTGGKS